VTVQYADAEPSGLGAMLGGLIEQNLERDPSRSRLLRPAVASIAARDAGVSVTLQLEPGRVLVADGTRAAHLRIVADSDKLLELTTAPLRFGLPDAFSKQGRAVLGDVLTRRVRIGGMMSHPVRLARLTLLLSVR
jgi:hypothetical protein